MTLRKCINIMLVVWIILVLMALLSIFADMPRWFDIIAGIGIALTNFRFIAEASNIMSDADENGSLVVSFHLDDEP